MAENSHFCCSFVTYFHWKILLQLWNKAKMLMNDLEEPNYVPEYFYTSILLSYAFTSIVHFPGIFWFEKLYTYIPIIYLLLGESETICRIRCNKIDLWKSLSFAKAYPQVSVSFPTTPFYHIFQRSFRKILTRTCSLDLTPANTFPKSIKPQLNYFYSFPFLSFSSTVFSSKPLQIKSVSKRRNKFYLRAIRDRIT